MSDDLDTTDMPDTPSQSAVVVAAETRPPPVAAMRLFSRFVRHRRRAGRLPRNVRACAPLIGRCTSLPTSLTRVVGCVVASRISCYRLRTVFDVLCVVVGKRSVLLVAFRDCKLRETHNMSQSHRNESESSSSSSDYHWDGLPSPDVLRRPHMPKVWMERAAQTESIGYVGPFRGLGLPNRGNDARGRAPMAARGFGGGRHGGRAGRRNYQPRQCGLCTHDHVYDSHIGLNNHSTKRHGFY